MPSRTVSPRRSGQLRNLDVIHQSQAEYGLAFQCGTRSARRQHDHLPWPQRRQQPFDDIALGMPFAIDGTSLVDLVSASGNDFRVERQIAAGHTDAIKLQFQISLAKEVTRILGGFEVSDEVASTRERLLAEFSNTAEMTENGISNINGGRGKIGFVQRALQKSAGGHDNIACAGAESESKKGHCEKGEKQPALHTSPRSQGPGVADWRAGSARGFGHLITAPTQGQP